MKLNERIKELEESEIKKDNDLEVIRQELEEEKEISQNALELINEKEDEIAELKKKIGGGVFFDKCGAKVLIRVVAFKEMVAFVDAQPVEVGRARMQICDFKRQFVGVVMMPVQGVDWIV